MCRKNQTPLYCLFRNIVGVTFLLLGIIMIFMPGSGMFIILLAILSLYFPGKRRLEIYLVKKPSIFKILN